MILREDGLFKMNLMIMKQVLGSHQKTMWIWLSLLPQGSYNQMILKIIPSRLIKKFSLYAHETQPFQK